ncbi:hypothetical protein GCM10022243_23840 [Saccharothrix violaceirubra]|uniref:Uncharacterized protein n=1 Tax=Saccharothrix violaceirubra TaxID=413306 RepID=A0A7W7T771_9PSEU|nr:hypothetical protein [Saccharothrix violaceirubra]MBB4967829.1 hypothetical protein [Saccharothrix violaceirubra]
MASRRHPGQFDLFADAEDRPEPVETRRGRPSGFGGKPDLLVEVFDLVHDGRVGRLEHSGRVVELDGDGHCRHAHDDVAAMVESLLVQRYAVECGSAVLRHGAVRRDVLLVKLTRDGQNTRTRWSHLRGAR